MARHHLSPEGHQTIAVWHKQTLNHQLKCKNAISGAAAAWFKCHRPSVVSVGAGDDLFKKAHIGIIGVILQAAFQTYLRDYLLYNVQELNNSRETRWVLNAQREQTQAVLYNQRKVLFSRLQRSNGKTKNKWSIKKFAVSLFHTRLVKSALTQHDGGESAQLNTSYSDLLNIASTSIFCLQSCVFSSCAWLML